MLYTSIGRQIAHFYTSVGLINQQGIQIHIFMGSKIINPGGTPVPISKSSYPRGGGGGGGGGGRGGAGGGGARTTSIHLNKVVLACTHNQCFEQK